MHIANVHMHSICNTFAECKYINRSERKEQLIYELILLKAYLPARTKKKSGKQPGSPPRVENSFFSVRRIEAQPQKNRY